MRELAANSQICLLHPDVLELLMHARLPRGIPGGTCTAARSGAYHDNELISTDSGMLDLWMESQN